MRTIDNRDREALQPYTLADPEATETFLSDRPHLWKVLNEAPTRIRAAFRKPVSLRLEIFCDRDSPGFKQLHLVVVTDMLTEHEWDAADASIRCIHEDWLKSLPRAITRDLFVTAEPR